MDQEKPQREFFKNEIMLKLYKGFDLSDYEGRISFVKEEAEKVREFFVADIFEKNLNSFIAHCYLDAEEYGKAIPYFEKLIGHEDPHDPNSYFFLKDRFLSDVIGAPMIFRLLTTCLIRPFPTYTRPVLSTN